MHSGIAFPLSSAVLSECVRPPCNNKQALESRGLVRYSFDSGWLGLARLCSLYTVRVGLRLHFSIVWASPCVIFRNLGHLPVLPCFNQDTPAPLPPEAHWLEPVTWPHPRSKGSRKSEEIQLVDFHGIYKCWVSNAGLCQTENNLYTEFEALSNLSRGSQPVGCKPSRRDITHSLRIRSLHYDS